MSKSIRIVAILIGLAAFTAGILGLLSKSISVQAFAQLIEVSKFSNPASLSNQQKTKEYLKSHKNKDADVFGGAGTHIRRESRKIIASDGSPSDRFGSSVAIDQDTLVIGATGDRGTTSVRGSAYVFVRSGTNWLEQARLTPSDNNSTGAFGVSVGIDGDTIIIGDNGRSSNESAYIFTRNGVTWTEQQKLTASDAADTDLFGTSVSISGNTVVVGASADDDGGNSTGSAYVFTRNGSTWTEQQKLLASDRIELDRFGESVSIDGNTVIVGARTAGINDEGAAYIYVRSGSNWSEQQKLLGSDITFGNEFGNSVAIEGDSVVIGAHLDDENGFFSGSAYIFTRLGGIWSELQKLSASDGEKRDEFGIGLDISGDKIVIGSYLDDDNGLNSGSAYVFVKAGSNWIEQSKILPSVGFATTAAGRAVATDGNLVIFGAPRDNTINGNTSGSTYLFGKYTSLDFDGDSKTDISVFRPSLGQWWYLKSSDFGNRGFQFGSPSDIPVPADFTGDRKTDLAFFRPSTGQWFVLRSEDFSFYAVPFGVNGDIPAPADYDGDGKTDTAVYRPSDTFWYIDNSAGGTTFQQFGLSEDKPVVADYDGDGKDDIAVFRPSVSQWWLLRSTAGVIGYQFGTSGDKTVPGYYTVDGKADVAIFRPLSGFWYILRSEDSSFYSVPFGNSTDNPTAGDYDGDGRFDTAVFRPSDNFWYVDGTTSGFFQIRFGTTGDIPLPGLYSAGTPPGSRPR